MFGVKSSNHRKQTHACRILTRHDGPASDVASLLLAVRPHLFHHHFLPLVALVQGRTFLLAAHCLSHWFARITIVQRIISETRERPLIRSKNCLSD